ncbi:TBCC-domain-containing protein [Neoconidiobolus thromboides FSU 785]|nr:TBCC-domain-containing protein [Neoconidiobolus thromboides FSU 785]
MDTKENGREEFYKQYKLSVQEIEDLLNSLEAINKNEIEKINESILLKIQSLQELTQNYFPFLPSYEQKSYQEDLKRLKDRITQLRNSLTPKPKFGFRKRELLKNNTEMKVNSEPKVIKEKSKEEVSIEPRIGFKGNTFEIKNMKKRIITIDKVEDLTKESSTSVNISEIENSVIDLINKQTKIATLYLKEIKDSIILLPPVLNSILIQNCFNCIIYVASQQYRMHGSKNCQVFLSANSNPIIEDCTDIRFGKYLIEFENENEEELFKHYNINYNPENNLYNKVDDFNWLKQTASPNWGLLKDTRINLVALRSIYPDINLNKLYSFFNEFTAKSIN